MPTYDYQCRSCGHTIEVIHAMSQDGPVACELCGGPLRRVLFPAGIIFKGSGFYKTDSRSGSSSSGSSSSSGNGSSSSSESGSSKSTSTTDAGSKPPSSSTDASGGSSAKLESNSKPSSGDAA